MCQECTEMRLRCYYIACIRQSREEQNSEPYWAWLRVTAICLFHNSLIIHAIIHQIVFGYFDLYVNTTIIWGWSIYVKTHISHTKSINIPISIRLTILAPIIIGFDIHLNGIHYPTVNMQDFRYWLCTSILDFWSAGILTRHM